jgi:hypothetical protein
MRNFFGPVESSSIAGNVDVGSYSYSYRRRRNDLLTDLIAIVDNLIKDLILTLVSWKVENGSIF